MIDQELLRKGTLWQYTEDNPYNRIRYLSGMPNRLWNAGHSKDAVAFETFKSKKTWREGDEERPLAHYGSQKQMDFFDGVLEACGGPITPESHKTETRLTFDQYIGRTIMVSSMPTDSYAETAAAVICNMLLLKHPESLVRWSNINLLDPWERRKGVKWHINPRIVVLTGLMTKPTSEQRGLVSGMRDWACSTGLCILVGTGCDPVELAHRWFRVKPDSYLYLEGNFKKSKHVG